MPDIRYSQFCPMTRAVEILGERWTLLLLRELFHGPKRFSDLKATLGGLSTSVLAERLARLEERGIIVRRELPAPAASVVYELADSGWALRPVLMELARWGVRFMTPPTADDRMEPAWLRFGLEVFARRSATPPLTFRLRITGETAPAEAYVRGSDEGVHVGDDAHAVQATIVAPAMDMLMLCGGYMPLAAALAAGTIRVEGDTDVAARVAELFDFSPTPPAAPAPTAGVSIHDPSSPALQQRSAEPKEQS